MYKGKRQIIDWSKYLAPRFCPPLESKDSYPEGGCGTHALSVLTGLSLRTIQRKMPKGSDTWSDRSMKKFLRDRGFTILPVTIGSTCSHTSPNAKREMKLTSRHVILFSQHAYIDEGTWAVLYKSLEYHSGEVCPMLPIDFFNYPIWSAYVVWHPKWGPKSMTEKLMCKYQDYLSRVSIMPQKRRQKGPLSKIRR